MPNELLTPPELDPSTEKPASLHAMPQFGRPSSDHLGIGGGLQEEGIFGSLWANLRDAFFPPKLPPLVLTSQPIAVPDRMKVQRSPASTATAIVVHALLLLLIGWLIYKVGVKVAAPAHPTTVVDLNAPPIAPMAAKAMGGGGSNHDATPATMGKVPPPQKINTPMMKPIIDHPKLALPPAPDMQPMKINASLPDLGAPTGAKVGGPSLGNGGGNGVGNGPGGNGAGNGGPAGCCSGVYQVGGGVSAPIAIDTPEAEFSEEARRAKYQGDVNVDIVVGADGLVKSARVMHDPGMGLAENALIAVRKWRFKPAMKDGKPVAVRITGVVTFTIY